MIPEELILIGVVISFIGVLSYLIDTLKGKTQPNKVTWFVWALAPLIAFWAELNQSVGIHSLLTFIAGFNPLLIFLASFFNKKSQWKIGKLDIICFLLSILGLVLWQVTQIGNAAILFSIFAGGIAGIPTVIKSFRFPETESYNVFLGGGIAALITLLAIDIWNFEYYAFPLYIFLICLLLFVLIKFKIGKRLSKIGQS